MSFSFIRKSRIFGIAIIILVVLTIRTIFQFLHETSESKNSLNEIHNVKAGYHFRRITLSPRPTVIAPPNTETTSNDDGPSFSPSSLEKECNDFRRNPKCESDLLTSP